ncbi:hypothetical protein G5V59_02555 [Nocardioides sp. W3-2-3]|uniref:hypothetical protein n=1 Tax=Nocardioides convexus TaxID=2712224 RepID=UPI0024183351|nr:hypothetical protein [Nocardioides convexus]NGZ99634.1 hypothetical protein [Nocardioides convexus]
MTSPGDDVAQPCAGGLEHVWAMRGLHLSLKRGAEVEEYCARPGCDGLRYVSRPGGRKSAPPSG